MSEDKIIKCAIWHFHDVLALLTTDANGYRARLMRLEMLPEKEPNPMENFLSKQKGGKGGGELKVDEMKALGYNC